MDSKDLINDVRVGVGESTRGSYGFISFIDHMDELLGPRVKLSFEGSRLYFIDDPAGFSNSRGRIQISRRPMCDALSTFIGYGPLQFDTLRRCYYIDKTNMTGERISRKKLGNVPKPSGRKRNEIRHCVSSFDIESNINTNSCSVDDNDVKSVETSEPSIVCENKNEYSIIDCLYSAIDSGRKDEALSLLTTLKLVYGDAVISIKHS